MWSKQFPEHDHSQPNPETNLIDKPTPVAVSVFGVNLYFADGTPVTAEMFENESSQTAMDRAEAIDDDELEEEMRILDALREDPSRADELADKGGISYRYN